MPQRLPLIDALKALASQLIVLHHLSLYGPLPDALRPWAGALVDLSAEYGRLAVQVFLVIAGFLAANALAPGGVVRAVAPLPLIGRRWLRLAGPYAVAIGAAVCAAALARALSPHPDIPAAPTAWQLLANLAMLQDLLGEEALSTGVWYVAIDLQLYACFVLLMALAACTGSRVAAPLLAGALTIASLLAFNRMPGLDSWAPYFFGAYGLGAMAAWAGTAGRPYLGLAAIAAISLLAMWIEPRSRIGVAAVTALLLAWHGRGGGMPSWMPRWAAASRLLGWLGRISFSVFLIHYSVLVVAIAISDRWLAADPLANALLAIATFVACTAAGALFHRHVESVLVPAPRRADVARAAPVVDRAEPGPDVEDADTPAAAGSGPR